LYLLGEGGGDYLITRKDLMVSVLCTFCLTTVLFTMMPVQSAEWDPWLDVKEDGRINVLDLIKTASALGTMGDTTKNVTVKNWPANKLAYYYADIMLPSQTETSPWISVNEYSRIVVCIHVITAIPNEYRLVAATNALTFELYVDTQTNFGENLYKTYDAPNDQIQIRFSNHDIVERQFYATVYLIP
jgi:hypothetical protein